MFEDPWSTRGWTLQEVIAANKIICFTKDWRPVNGETGKFHADRGNDTKISPVYNELVEVTGSMNWHCFMVDISWWWTNFENMYRVPPIDPTISFDSKGVMRIMASLHPLHSTSPSQPQAFALLGGRGVAQTRVGVMLVRCTSLPGYIYRRIGLGECDESIIQGDKAPEWVFIK
ncbi:hypothetical protein AB1N83_001437 [Pleurotus pulmonarius]